VALDQGYIAPDRTDELIDQHRKLAIMLYNFMEHLKGSNRKGPKYSRPKPKKESEKFEALLQQHLQQ